MKHYFQFIVLLTTGFVFGQPPIEWQKTIGGTGNDYSGNIFQTADGGYILGGHSNSINGDITGTNGGYDFKLIKLTSVGAIEWQRTYGGSGTEAIRSMSKTPDGGYILIGYTTSTNGDVLGNDGGQDVWIVKVNNVGIIEWQKTYGGTKSDDGNSISPTADGGYVFCGTARSSNGDLTFNHNVPTSGNSTDIWVVKIDNVGTIVWQKALGGTIDDQARVVKETATGDFYIAGLAASNDGDITVNYGGYDIWVVKLNSTGGIIWQNSYGTHSADEVSTFELTTDGGLLLLATSSSNSGMFTGNHGQTDGLLVKIDSTGIIEWTKFHGGSFSDALHSMYITADGGYIFSGSSDSVDNGMTNHDGFADYWIVKTDNVGNLQWQKNIGGNDTDSPISAIQTSDGNYIVTGLTLSNDGDVTGNHGNIDFWVVKLGSVLSLDIVPLPTRVSLYPNPAINNLNVVVHPNDIGSIYSIYDISGKLIISGIIAQENSSISVADLSSGTYTLRLKDSYNIKFIKQ